jgi:hypothetical protein
MLKGHAKIELTDVVTGEKTVVEEDNLVTNAVQYLLAFMNKINRQPSNEIFPIATNALGGLMLFSDTLAEDPNNMSFPGNASLVGYADRNSNTDDTMRGSLNAIESYATDRGYVSVWDFSTSQANGTIASLALTSRYAGANPILRQLNGDLRGSVRYIDAYMDMHVLAYKDDFMYFRYRGSRDIKKGRCAVYGIKVEEYWFGGTELPVEQVATLPSEFQTDWAYYDNGNDGYIYYITKTDQATETYNTYSAGNSSGNAVINITPIKYSDESFDVGQTTTVTLEKVYLYGRSTDYNCISGGYLYWVSYDRKGIYIINMSNYADVQLISIGDEENLAVNFIMPLTGGGINFQFSYKKGNNTYTKAGLLYANGNLVKCSVNGEIVVREPRFALDDRIAFYRNYDGYYGDDYMGYRLRAAYLGTINNLSSPVVKMPTQTMKVTYTLNNIEEV